MLSISNHRGGPMLLLAAITMSGCGLRSSPNATNEPRLSKAEGQAPQVQHDPSSILSERKEPTEKPRGPALSDLIENVDYGVVLITVFDSNGAAVGQGS